MNRVAVRIGLLGQQGHGKATLAGVLEVCFQEPDVTVECCTDEWRSRSPGRPWIASSPAEGVHERHFFSAGREYRLTYCRTHRDYVHALITGNAVMYAAVLVVASDDGATRETCEPVRLAHLLGIRHVVVFLSKTDATADESGLADIAELETREVLARFGYPADDLPFIRGKARVIQESDRRTRFEAAGLEELLAVLDRLPLPAVERISEPPFLMSVEDPFEIKGRGTVVTGMIERGVVRAGDAVEVVGGEPSARPAVVAATELLFARPGRSNFGLLLRDVERNRVQQGNAVAAPGSISAHRRFESVLYLFAVSEGGRRTAIYSGYRPGLERAGTQFCTSITLPPGQDSCKPGGFTRAEVALSPDVRLPVEVGMRFALHEGSRRVACGVVTRIVE
jgi:elongation factor Tu